MNISYKWLKRYIDFNLQPKELAAVFTSLGLECDTVEEVESIRGGLRGLVIGKVLTCEDHPDSDHLHVTTVDLGTGEPVQIVCGAPNVAAGQTVVVATVGTTLYDGDKEFNIKKSKIRGKESFGMICAEDEIGVGKSHDGIIVIEEDIAPGTPAAKYFNVESDYRLEVELTPNRVDAASHYGTARDLKARMWCDIYEKGDGNSEYPEISVPDVSSFSVDRKDGATSVRVDDVKACPRYSGVTLRGVTVKESPEWLRQLLEAAGQRPINNIVDITNFILLGLGQPLHCFDLNRIEGGIVVRKCDAGTKFTTLDGTEHTLHQDDLMICDEKKPMCIAGVFGGLDSGVTEATTDVFIESAYFNPTSVRRTARRHGLSTDASFRYERGTDPNITVYAAKLAAILIRELAGGEICGDVSDNYPQPINKAELDFSIRKCNALIGKTLSKGLIECILRALEFDVEPTDNSDVLHLRVPTYRVDVYRECDVVEEILRVYGYNNVEISADNHSSLSRRGETDFSYALQQSIADSLTGAGFMEILNNSLTAVGYYEDNDRYPLEQRVRLLNPLSNDLAVLRGTLLYGGLETISHNVNRRLPNLRLYEFGKVYSFDSSKEATEKKPLAPYSEHEVLGIWLTGDYTLGGWNVKKSEATFYDLKAIVLNILRRAGIPAGTYLTVQESDNVMAAKLTASTRQGQPLFEMGIVRNNVLAKFDIEQPVVYAEINWKTLYGLSSRNEVLYKPLPRTQPVERDLSLLIDSAATMQQLEDIIRKAERKLLRSISLFDVYEGKNLPAGKKSYAVKLTLQDDEKTLNDKQIDAVMTKIVKALREAGVELR